MSTRGLVTVVTDRVNKNNPDLEDINQKSRITIYNHFDSYPEGLGESLKELVNLDAFIHRNNDYSYQTMSICTWIGDRNQPEMMKLSDFTGSGIHKDLEMSWDIEFFYIINLKEKHVRCYKPVKKDLDAFEKVFDLECNRKLPRELINDNYLYNLEFIEEYPFKSKITNENYQNEYITVQDIRGDKNDL